MVKAILKNQYYLWNIKTKPIPILPYDCGKPPVESTKL
jgi:hypothetical protein